MPDSVKYLLPEDRIPRAWYHIAADLPQPPPPPLHPRHRQADRPRRPRGDLPDGAHRPGGLGRARDRDFRNRCATSTSYGGHRRSIAPAASNGSSIRRPAPKISASAGSRQAEHVAQAFYNREAGVRKLSTETVPANGLAGLSPGNRSASKSRSTWSRSASSRSPTAAR